MRVLFRVEASEAAGSGHLWRCLALATALRREGASISFISRTHPGNLHDLVRDHGFLLHELPAPEAPPPEADQTPHGRWLGVSQAQDAAETLALIAPEGIDWIVVDHYGLDARWERALRSRTRGILVVDDLADRDHDCDALLDVRLCPDPRKRYEGRVPASCACLLGPEYLLLRDSFAELRGVVARRRAAEPRRVLVFLGGSDPDGITLKALEALDRPTWSHLQVDVVAGSGNPHRASIQELAARRPGTTFHPQTARMAELMAEADLALGAGGTTAWERACLGLPSLVATLAENQVPTITDMESLGLIRSLGPAEALDAAAWAQALEAALSDWPAFREGAAQGPAWVDGSGAARVARFLVRGPDPADWTCRTAWWGDCACYHEWASDWDVRRQAFHPEPIPWEAHVDWFHRRLEDPDTALLLVEAPSGPVGQVRFDRREGAWHIDYSLGRAFRGRGLGGALLAHALEAFQPVPPLPLIGDVKSSNPPSLKVFQSLGFLETGTGDPRVIRFIRPVSSTPVPLA